MNKSLIIDLYKKQFKIICLYLVKCGCSMSDAEDIVHDSFIKTIEYMGYIKIENLSSWLFKVAMNNYKNKLKRGKIIKITSVYEEKFYEELVDECDVEEKILTKELSVEVIKTLNSLKEQYRLLLVLKYDMDLTYKEISMLLGIEENMVKTYLYRSRNKFKEEWRKLDEEIIKKDIRKAKIKLSMKIILICIIVFLVGLYANIRLCIEYSNIAFEANEANVKLAVPNGYISKSNDIFGFLGGSGTYTISKNIGGKSVILEEKISLFGCKPPMNISRGMGERGNPKDEWHVPMWENGYKKLLFFNPEIQYNNYKNDLEVVDKVPDNKIIEMAISFDKAYGVDEIYSILGELRPTEITWMWLDEFAEDKKEEFRREAEDQGHERAYIQGTEAIGIPIDGIPSDIRSIYDDEYDRVIDYLGKSNDMDHKELYKEIMKRGKTPASEAKMLGVVVQGTKEQLLQLKGNAKIKAASIGVVTDPIY